MTEETLAIPRAPVIPTTTQCASTQAVLDRDPKLDELHWNRGLPSTWKAVPDAKTTDEVVAKRSIDPAEAIVVEGLRHASRNTLGTADLYSSVDKEKRDKGIWAFTYSKPTKLTAEQVKKVTRLEEIVNTPLEPVEKPKKLGMLGRLKAMLQGDAGLEMFNDPDAN